MNRTTIIMLSVAIVAVVALSPGITTAGAPRVIAVLADSDNLFKLVGQKKAVITVKAGEVIRLKLTAKKGSEWDKDGAVHSFTVNALKDQGWDIRLKEGTQEVTLVAPSEPGEYVIECTVKCGEGHDEMKMKLIVTP